VRKGHEFDVQVLKTYLDEKLADYLGTSNNVADEPITVKQFVHGQSNPTYSVEYRGKKLVLRKKPPGKLLKGAHMVGREYRVMSALYNVKFPVPRPVLHCEDDSIVGTEFYMMEFVRGRVFLDPLIPEVSPEERREIYLEMSRVLAQLHSYDPLKIGLEGYGKADASYYDRQIKTWTRQYESAKTNEIKHMDELIEWLPSNSPGKGAGRVTVVHGDYRLGNVIFHPTEPKILAVLDWELSTLGDPYADLAYNCMGYYLPNQDGAFSLMTMDKGFSGIPREKEFRREYLRHFNKEDISKEDWKFYLSFSMFRLASIAQGVYKRSLLGNASSPYANTFLKRTMGLARLAMAIIEEKLDLLGNMFRLKFPDYSEKFYELRQKLLTFMDEEVFPIELRVWKRIRADPNRWQNVPPELEELKTKAKAQGLWNLFLPAVSGLKIEEYAHLCEITGQSPLAPELFNCSAPDTGNMEILHKYGNEDQKKQWLEPLLEGSIRSCFAMTEPGVGSSDATNINTTIEPTADGKHYVVTGRKWYISGAGDPRCRVAIVMGVTKNAQKRRHEQHSIILVPMDHPGVKVIRPMEVFGFDDAPHGHMDMSFDAVQVPAANLLLGEGRGFEMAQGRLGPGRIHHCMRLLGMAERAYNVMCHRATNRKAFGKLLADHDFNVKEIARSRIEIDQARLLTVAAARAMDQYGNKMARKEVSMIKVVAPNVAVKVIDRAIQIMGAAGVSQDSPVSYLYIAARTLRLADGPDEAHLNGIGRAELMLYRAKM